jgi:hypothetical protein
MSSPNNTSSPSTTIKIMCSCVGCERGESMLAQAHLLGLAPSRWDEVRNTFKCRYVSCHDHHAYGAEGKVYISPTPNKRLKKLVVLNYSHSRNPPSKRPESHPTKECARAHIRCLNTEPNYYYCPITLVMS